MKKYFMLMASLLFTAGCLVSCGPTEDPEDPGKKDDPTKDPAEVTAVVSLSGDTAFNASNKATLTLTLSEAAATDVKVKLAKADIQSGKTLIPVDFPKNVTIAKGDTKATVEVEADVMGLSAGDYQAAIKIDSAEGAKVADNSVVYINISFVFKPEVNLYADSNFKSDGTAKLTISLAKAAEVEVKVNIDLDPASTADVKFEKSVTIPAGETSFEIPVTVNIPADLAPGIYPAIFNIASVENGELGKATSATINLSYPFTAEIMIDGVFDDWAEAATQTCELPEGCLFTDMISMSFCANSKYLYVYFKFVDPGYDIGRPFDFYIDNDGDPATGCYVPSLNNAGEYAGIPPIDQAKAGVKWYVELPLHDGDKYWIWANGRYGYNGDDGASVWTALALEGDHYDPTDVFAQGIIEDGIGHLEVQLSREVYKLTGTKARFFAKLMDGANDWNCLGVLPQEPSADGKTYTPADMFTVYMPEYAQ